MSYCRWSSDGFGCDLYIYGDCHGGYTTHVASRRVIGDCPKIDWTDAETLGASYKAQMAFMKTCEREDIGLPHDGESFNDSCLYGLLDRLLELRALGYNFPDGVLHTINEELEEELKHEPQCTHRR